MEQVKYVDDGPSSIIKSNKGIIIRTDGRSCLYGHESLILKKIHDPKFVSSKFGSALKEILWIIYFEIGKLMEN